jgi:hypothetical protein
MDAVTAAYDKLKKDSANRGRKNLNKTPSPNVRSLGPQGLTLGTRRLGKAGMRGDPALADMELVDEDVFIVEGGPAELFDATDMDNNSTGVAFLSATSAAVHLISQKRCGKPTKLPCCIVCKKIAFDAGSMLERQELHDYYGPTHLKLHFKEKHGRPRLIDCLVFQLGSKPVFVRDTDQDDIMVIESDKPLVCKLSVSIPNHADVKDFDKIKDSFAKDAAAAIGSKLLLDANNVKYLNTKTDYSFRKKTIKVHNGITFVAKESLEAVFRRSGYNGVIVQESFRNEAFTILRLKEEPTLENA